MHKKIFVLDDDEVVVLIFENILGPAGYHVSTHTRPETALKKIVDFMPDLMILDLTMPMKDGYELICDIRGTPAVAHIPIMVVTAADDLVLFNKVMKAGVLGYFNKPIVPNEVITKLKELIR